MEYVPHNSPLTLAFKAVDPILKPGVSDPKVLHLHMFGGSDVLKTAVTPEDLEESSCTSAENPNDGSVYWTASLINKHTGAALRPIRWAAYYIGIVSMLVLPD